jgi:CheY-like chemotaxis protein
MSRVAPAAIAKMASRGYTQRMEFSEPASKLVLIVDDDESMLELMKMLVEGEGFRIDSATTGVVAMQKVKAAEPDLIVLDLMMPGKAGYEVVKELQAEGAGNVPIVVVTGRSIDSKLKDMLRQEPNVRELMSKPLPRNFVTALHSHLGTRPRDKKPDA